MKSWLGLLVRWAVLGGLLVASSAWAAPLKGEGVSLPKDISTHGELIDAGLHFGNVAVVVLFLMVVVWLLIAGLKHTSKQKAKYDHGNNPRAAFIVAGFTMVIFLFLDGHHFYSSVVQLDDVFWNWEKADAPDAVRVEVNARQWAWQFRYAGPDGKFATPDDVVTLNDLRVPVDRPISIQLRAVDVIHSLYIPNVRVKTDAVPGMTNRLWFQVDSKKLAEVGHNEFEIACAQHCGTWHYKMGAVMTVYDQPGEFEAWLKEAAVNSKLDYTEPAQAEGNFGPHWGWEWEKI